MPIAPVLCLCSGLAWLHEVHPSCSLSFSTVLLHVVCGLPTLRDARPEYSYWREPVPQGCILWRDVDWQVCSRRCVSSTLLTTRSTNSDANWRLARGRTTLARFDDFPQFFSSFYPDTYPHFHISSTHAHPVCMQNNKIWRHDPLLCPALGGIKRWCASDVWRLSDVCLSRTSGLSREQRGHVTRTPLSRSKGQKSTCRGWGILWRPSAQLVGRGKSLPVERPADRVGGTREKFFHDVCHRATGHG